MENQADCRARLLDQARESSSSSGVYLMKDAAGKIQYVGKAKCLRNRLSSYFQPAAHDSPRVEMLVGRIHHFDVILTETEAEALILECTLIKKHKPKFNVQLKDDKSYPFLRVDLHEAFPRLEPSRRPGRDQARYFGPFPSAWALRETIQLLNRAFRLRTCSENAFRHRSRPCLLHQMGQCTAPCVGLISSENYGVSLREAVEVVEGKGEALLSSLRKAMNAASEDEDYEEAARIRDQLQSLEAVTEAQSVVEAGSDRDRDVVGIAQAPARGLEDEERSVGSQVAILQIRGGKLISVRHLRAQNAGFDADLLADLVSQLYLSLSGAERDSAKGQFLAKPKSVLLPAAPEDPSLLERATGVACAVAESENDRQLLRVAEANARHALEQALAADKGHGAKALAEVQDKLGLDRLPFRIECYDISNIQGQDAVGSRVVFIDGAPEKSLYRRYRIRSVEGANDFAMMKEVLSRRFMPSDEARARARDGSLPDLIVVDGGRGQLAQAMAILDEIGAQGIAVCGLAKAKTESDFRSSEVRASEERVFLPGRKNPVALYPSQPAFALLTHVRDEAHRFAIGYHRHLRGKRSLASESQS